VWKNLGKSKNGAVVFGKCSGAEGPNVERGSKKKKRQRVTLSIGIKGGG